MPDRHATRTRVRGFLRRNWPPIVVLPSIVVLYLLGWKGV